MAGTSFYIEGSRSYVRIEYMDGTKVAEEMLAGGERPGVSLRVNPGDYRIFSWQRPCDGNCGLLDPPTDECDRTLSVPSGEVVRGTIEVRPGEGCTIVMKP
jgi:hypothetical protein